MLVTHSTLTSTYALSPTILTGLKGLYAFPKHFYGISSLAGPARKSL